MIKNQKRVDEIEVISTKDVHVGMEYPYLPTSRLRAAEWEWEIHNVPFSLLDQAQPDPTVRLVKDNKVGAGRHARDRHSCTRHGYKQISRSLGIASFDTPRGIHSASRFNLEEASAFPD